MTIDLYYGAISPPCRSVLLLGKALGLQFNIIKTNAGGGDTKTPEFLKINPEHCIPTIVDKGFSLWESRAILGYLVDKYGKDDSLYPRDPKKRALVNQRLYFDIGTLYPRFREYLLAVMKGETPNTDVTSKSEEAYELLNKFLEGQDWLAGDNITIADYSFAVIVAYAEYVNYDLSKHQNVVNWLSRAKKAIAGFEEIQNTGYAELKSMFAAMNTSQK